jgi:hypothetical protein
MVRFEEALRSVPIVWLIWAGSYSCKEAQGNGMYHPEPIELLIILEMLL